MANIIGVQTIDGIYIINVDTDPTTGGGTAAPLGSYALASDGSGTFYKSGALDTEWSASPIASLYGVVRYVYLVNDASDQLKLGGVSNNVYITAQEAYDAANVLQVLLGGSNRVIIKVGVTNSADVGGIALSGTYNSLVEWVGQTSTASVIGTVSAGTNTMNIKFTNMGTGVVSSSTGALTVTAIYCALGSVINTGGATVTLTLRDSSMTSLTTSNTTGATSNVTITNSNNSTITAITATSSLGNIGTLTFTSCNNITVTGALSMTQTSTTTSFSVGTITMTNCSQIRFHSTVTVTMAFVTSTGTIGGLSINSTNQDILFTGNVRITGYANVTNTSSNVVITSIYCVNCTFGGLFINNRTVGFSTWEGGTITLLNFHKCFFRSRVRISYNNTTDITTGATFRMTDCQIIGSNDGSALDFYVLASKVSFDSFVIQGIETNYQGVGGYDGLSVANTIITTPTVPFTIDGVSATFSNINGYSFLIELYNPTTANSTYDAIVSGCNLTNLSLQIVEGDINFKVIDSGSSNNYYLISVALTPPTKRTELIGCYFNIDVTDLSFYGQIPVTLKNTYFGYYTNAVNPLTQDIISYNSFIESFAETGSITTWGGTYNTSTLRRLTTDSVVGAIFNNSYDESY